MDVGIAFFPDVDERERAAVDYFADSLDLTARADELGYHHVRTVEHYFRRYGGYSPNPVVFLAAAAQRTRRLRLVTGAVLPAFNHPLKLAGEIGMLDALSGGRLDVGFARAFLPHEFERFGIDLGTSRQRFTEGVALVRRLLTETDVAHEGTFHSFPPTTSLPRPTQRPHPPLWVGALTTPESFRAAGEGGFGLMAQPVVPSTLRDNLARYRQAWREAGHPGAGRVMLAFHAYCHEDGATARRTAGPLVDRYLGLLLEAAREWRGDVSSADYEGYRQLFDRMSRDSFESLDARGSTMVGSPQEIVDRLGAYHEACGGFDVASMQVSFSNLDVAAARRSLELLAEHVLPGVRSLGRPADEVEVLPAGAGGGA